MFRARMPGVFRVGLRAPLPLRLNPNFLVCVPGPRRLPFNSTASGNVPSPSPTKRLPRKSKVLTKKAMQHVSIPISHFAVMKSRWPPPLLNWGSQLPYAPPCVLRTGIESPRQPSILSAATAASPSPNWAPPQEDAAAHQADWRVRFRRRPTCYRINLKIRVGRM